MKILLSAYSCLPHAGSEPGIGWSWAEGIARFGHQVFVITRANKREVIEEECRRRAIQNPHFIFHDLSPAVQKLYKLPFGNYAYYTLWQYSAAKRAAQVHASEQFDQVQHITWGSFRLWQGKCRAVAIRSATIPRRICCMRRCARCWGNM